MNCKSCKHWTLPKDSNWKVDEICRPVDPDTYEPMKSTFEVRVCTSPEIVKFERPLANNGVSLIDGSEYMAVMMTAENFGCINHSEAPHD